MKSAKLSRLHSGLCAGDGRRNGLVDGETFCLAIRGNVGMFGWEGSHGWEGRVTVKVQRGTGEPQVGTRENNIEVEKSSEE